MARFHTQGFPIRKGGWWRLFLTCIWSNGVAPRRLCVSMKSTKIPTAKSCPWIQNARFFRIPGRRNSLASDVSAWISPAVQPGQASADVSARIRDACSMIPRFLVPPHARKHGTARTLAVDRSGDHPGHDGRGAGACRPEGRRRPRPSLAHKRPYVNELPFGSIREAPNARGSWWFPY